MIKIKKFKPISVPCKDKFTGRIKEFTIYAEGFTNACKLLEFELELNWIIGYGSM